MGMIIRKQPAGHAILSYHIFMGMVIRTHPAGREQEKKNEEQALIPAVQVTLTVVVLSASSSSFVHFLNALEFGRLDVSDFTASINISVGTLVNISVGLHTAYTA